MSRIPPLPEEKRTGSARMTRRTRGPKSVPNTNALVRTKAANSRLATAQVLRKALLRGIDPAAGALEEDLAQRRARVLLLNSIDRTIEDGATAREDADVIAEPFSMLDQMGGEED